ncbi:arabinofuranosidase catalytic domain-containing protein [Erwinia phyllosphaerae]|uniref:arabinofuranosidase catalytic domain-containing protein n=1 Tax=Erwinia phyllosphaerae TaxID=2853256 RepID=UPI001FEE7A28|nr:arabinofuranosidase catalytic domain-containing protein [Erwinia phyllosphaerae]MBV4366309.1 hypothetical protein [Erwinia phyllosphaerae]
MLILKSNVAFSGSHCDLPFIGPLDGFKPMIALSLRRLFSSYNGPLINVRRSSDETTADIGFTSDGVLDAAALLDFAGEGDAFITIWYDQSGNGVHATRSVASGQPRIVKSGVLARAGGLPAVYFYDKRAFSLAPPVSGKTRLEAAVVVRPTASSAKCAVLHINMTSSLAQFAIGANYNSSGRMTLIARTSTEDTVSLTSSDSFSTSQLTQLYAVADYAVGNVELSQNGRSVAAGQLTVAANISSPSSSIIGLSTWLSSPITYSGYMSEVIVFSTESGDGDGISSEQLSYYSVV